MCHVYISGNISLYTVHVVNLLFFSFISFWFLQASSCALYSITQFNSIFCIPNVNSKTFEFNRMYSKLNRLTLKVMLGLPHPCPLYAQSQPPSPLAKGCCTNGEHVAYYTATCFMVFMKVLEYPLSLLRFRFGQECSSGFENFTSGYFM